MSPSDTHAEFAVVGAGPAGAHLAARLAAEGRSVLLLDPKAPWEKPCGGGITHKAWSKFPVLAHPDLKRNEVFTSLQVSPTGRFFVIDEGHALLMADRADLSRVMLNEAIQTGAVHLPHRVTRVESWGRSYRVRTDGGDFFAKTVVGADGVRSVVRKAFLGPLPKERTLASVCQFFEGGPEDPSLIRVTPFPGYAWAFARPDCLAAGVGAMVHGVSLKPELARFMEDFFPDRKPLSPMQGALLPYLIGRRAYAEPRSGSGWALIGDAAGFCDTLTGEGILYAVWSADLYAGAVLTGNLKAYERGWRKAFGRHLRTGAWAASRLFSRSRIDLFFTALTVCPSFRKPFMDFVWNQPPYHVLTARLLKAIPAARAEWRAFKKNGARVDPQSLGAFEPLKDKLTLVWK